MTSISWQVLQLSLADSRQYEGPEPQYAETKSSILRRRHSNAKLSNNSSNSTNSRRASQRQARRVASLSDLSSSRSAGQHQHQPPHSLRRRSSLSYDDLRWPTHPHTSHSSLYFTFPLRDPEVNMSRSNSLSTKKFSMYTGLSPKEKIEYRDYNDFRYDGLKKDEKIQ